MLNFDSHKSGSRSAHVVHFSAAFYTNGPTCQFTAPAEFR